MKTNLPTGALIALVDKVVFELRKKEKPFM